MDIFNKLTRKQLLLVAAGVILFAAIPLTYYLTQQQQDLRQRAAESSTYCGSEVNGCVNIYTGQLRYATNGTCTTNEQALTWGDGEKNAPVFNGCASLYTGQIRMAQSAGAPLSCNSNEVTLSWSQGNISQPNIINGCVNIYTSQLRIPNNSSCTSDETLVTWATNTQDQCITPTPTPLPTNIPTPTITQIPTSSPSPTISQAIPTLTLTPTPTGGVGGEPTPTSTLTPTSSPTLTPTPTPSGPTATPSPTPTTIPSVTPQPDESALVIVVDMPGIGNATGDNPNPLTNPRQADLEVSDTNNNIVFTQSLDMQFDSTLYKGSVTTPLTGIHYARVSFDNTLATTVPGVFTLTSNTTTTAQITELIPGDLDRNNILDIRDYNIFIGCYGDKQCAQKTLADLNDDGEVGAVDYNILLRSFAIRQGS